MQESEKLARHDENMQMQKGEVQKDFSRVAGTAPISFTNPNQRFVVYCLSHRNIPPLAQDPLRPGLRILRAFETQEDAIEHATEFAEKDAMTSVFVGAQGDWILGASDFQQLEDPVEMARITAGVVEAHEKHVKKAQDAFEKRVEKAESGSETTKPTGRVKKKKNASSQKAARLHSFKKQDFAKASSHVPRDFECVSQMFSVIALVTHPAPPDAVLLFSFQFIRAFETEKEADVFIRNTAAARFPTVDLFVNRNFAWTDIGAIDGQVRSHYRDDKLQAIVDRHDSQQHEAELHRQICEEQNVTPRVIEIGPKGMKVEEPLEPGPEPEPEPEPEPRRSQRLKQIEQ